MEVLQNASISRRLLVLCGNDAGWLWIISVITEPHSLSNFVI
jgi:hypothetical protein